MHKNFLKFVEGGPFVRSFVRCCFTERATDSEEKSSEIERCRSIFVPLLFFGDAFLVFERWTPGGHNERTETYIFSRVP